MIRVGGVVALFVSCVLAIVLFTGIRTLRLTGKSSTDFSTLSVDLDTGPGSVDLRSQDVPPSFPAGMGVTDGGRAVVLFFDVRDFPPNAPVQVIHRWVEIRRWRWAFGCTELQFEKRIVVFERSRASFFGTLGLVPAAPVLLWGLAALVMLIPLFRRNPPAAGV